jgi:MYXO-CTERM domain-containing protein
MRSSKLIGGCIAACAAGIAHGSFVMHESYAGWSAAAGDFATITFAELPPFSFVTTQYADMGLVFADNDGNWTEGPEYSPYPIDGFGLDGEGVVDILLSKQALGVGAHFPGGLRYRLYSAGALLYDSDLVGAGLYNNFRGVTSSSVAFDRVLITGFPFGGQVYLDNLYISFAPVPSPAGAAALSLLLLVARRRRRSKSDGRVDAS